jgi:hypothetical protein
MYLYKYFTTAKCKTNCITLITFRKYFRKNPIEMFLTENRIYFRRFFYLHSL